jgi:hypothetical protein
MFPVRGALGGALGGFILLLISVLFSIGHIAYPHLFVIQGLPLALGGGALVGAIVGTAIWMMQLITHTEFGAIGRAVVGFVIALIIIGLFSLIRTEDSGLAHEPISWTQQAINWMMVGIILGALSGLMARAKHRESTP